MGRAGCSGLFEGDWDGPTYTTCRNVGAVCDIFDIARRRAVLTFKHHAEVSALDPKEADELLDWCEQTEKPRSTRELRGVRAAVRVPRLCHLQSSI